MGQFDSRAYPHSTLTKSIIGAAMKVHTALGPGFLEKIYENALVRELAASGLPVKQQVRYPIFYEEYQVGEHILDLVVADKVYVELKCKTITPLETAQALSGLKASNMEICLLVNFNVAHLRDGIHRVVRSASPSS